MLVKGLLVATLCAFALSACRDLNSPEGCAEAFAEAVYEGNTAEAFKLSRIDRSVPRTDAEHTAFAVKTQVLAKIIDDRKHETQKLGGIRSVKAVKTSFSNDGEQAYVRVILVYGNRTTDNERVVLNKSHDGKWVPNPDHQI